MYDFRELTPHLGTEKEKLPAEAMTFNGHLLENEVSGYRTLQVQGRELLKNELATQTIGQSDGEDLMYSRHPSRDITVTYLLAAKTPLEFRQLFYRLNYLLTGDDVKFSFADDPSVYWIGTLDSVDEVDGGTDTVKSSFTLHCSDPYAHAVDEKQFPLDSGGAKNITVTFDDKIRGDDSGKSIHSAWGPELSMDLPDDFWYELPQEDYQNISDDDGQSTMHVRKRPNCATGVVERYNLFEALNKQIPGLWAKLSITDAATKRSWCVNNIDSWRIRAKASGHARDAYKVTAQLLDRNSNWSANSRVSTATTPQYLDFSSVDGTALNNYLQDNGDLIYMQRAEPAGFDANNYEQYKWANTKPDNWRPMANGPENNILVETATWGGWFVKEDGTNAVKDTTNWAASNTGDGSYAYVENGFVVIHAATSSALVAYKTATAGLDLLFDERAVNGTWHTIKAIGDTARPGYFDFPMKAGYEYRAPRQFTAAELAVSTTGHGTDWSPNIDDLDWNLISPDERHNFTAWSNSGGNGHFIKVNSEAIHGENLDAGQAIGLATTIRDSTTVGDVWHPTFLARATQGTARGVIRVFDNANNKEAYRKEAHALGKEWTLVSAELNLQQSDKGMNIDFLIEATGPGTHVEITHPSIFSGAKGGAASQPWNYALNDYTSNPTMPVDSPLVPYSIADFNYYSPQINQGGNYLTVNAIISQYALKAYGNQTHFIADFDLRQFGTTNDPKGKRVRLYMHDMDNDTYVQVTPEYKFTGDDSQFRMNVILPKTLSHYGNISMDLMGTLLSVDHGAINGTMVPYSDNWVSTDTATYEEQAAHGSANGQGLLWQGTYTGPTSSDPYVYSWEQRNIGEHLGNNTVNQNDDGTSWVQIDYAALDVAVLEPVTNAITIINNGTVPTPINLQVNMPGDNGYIGAGTAKERVLIGNVQQPDGMEAEQSRNVLSANFNNNDWFTVNDSKALYDYHFGQYTKTGLLSTGWASAGNVSNRWRLGLQNAGQLYDGWRGADAYMPFKESAANYSIRGYVEFDGRRDNSTGANLLTVQSDTDMIASIQMWNWFQTDVEIRIIIGNETVVAATKIPQFTQFIGEWRINRHGNHFDFSLMNAEYGGEKRTWSYDVGPSNTVYEPDLSKPQHEAHAVNWYTGKWGDNPGTGNWLLDMTVQKDNVTVYSDIPNTFKQGDQVIIESEDHKSTPYLNGAISYLLGDAGNKSLMAPVGTSYVNIQWSIWARRPTVIAKIRERFS